MTLRSAVLSHLRGAGLLLAFGGAIGSLTACRSGETEIPNPYNLTTDLRGDPAIERTWVEPDVERVASLSGGPNYSLYNLGKVQIGDDGESTCSISATRPFTCTTSGTPS